MFTKKEKAAIQKSWPQYRLMFMRDGSVMASRSAGQPYGLLYSREDAERHLKAVLAAPAGAKP